MRVLFISNDPSIFDATSSARARMRTYAALMEELHILSSAHQGTKEEQDGNLFLHPAYSHTLFRVFILSRRASALVRKHGIEVVSAQDPFEHGLAALFARRGTSAKLHVQVHTDFLSPWFVKGAPLRSIVLNRFRRLIADYVLPKAVGIRTVSQRVKTSLVMRYGSRLKEVSVIPISISAEMPAPAPLPNHRFTFSLIAVGRLEPEKRIEDILTALSLIIKNYPMIGLYVIGNGSKRAKLEHMTRVLALEKHVSFLGERSDAQALMRSGQAFIQASAYEGYGRTLVEAALARIPIITTSVGVVGEVFKDQDVLIAPVADPTVLARNITKLLEDTLLRQELPMHAEAAAREHVQKFDDIVTRIVSDLAWVLRV